VRLGRIQNYRNWSEALTAEPGATCLGLEYFCNVGDSLWEMSDADLTALGRREFAQIGLVDPARIKDGAVVRMEKADPVYDPEYRAHVAAIRAALAPFSNLQGIGRNGMHKYNNQDHSMMTGPLAARNSQGGRFSLWHVNTDAECHEAEPERDTPGRQVPEPLA
jgi:protoporphyrinogen oxidase